MLLILHCNLVCVCSFTLSFFVRKNVKTAKTTTTTRKKTNYERLSGLHYAAFVRMHVVSNNILLCGPYQLKESTLGCIFLALLILNTLTASFVLQTSLLIIRNTQYKWLFICHFDLDALTIYYIL